MGARKSEATAVLLDTLQELHRKAGAPSTRAVTQKIGHRRISHSTVNNAFKKIVKWPKLEMIVTALNGDVDTIRPLWQAAWSEQHPPRHPSEAPMSVVPLPFADTPSTAQPPAPVQPRPRGGLSIDLDLLVVQLHTYFDERPFVYQGRELPAPPEPEPAPVPKRRTPAYRRSSASEPGKDPRHMSAAELVGYVMTYQPDLARAWGWL